MFVSREIAIEMFNASSQFFILVNHHHSNMFPIENRSKQTSPNGPPEMGTEIEI
jgi:hypothetical protein